MATENNFVVNAEREKKNLMQRIANEILLLLLKEASSRLFRDRTYTIAMYGQHKTTRRY